MFSRMKDRVYRFFARLGRRRMKVIKGTAARRSVISERTGRNVKTLKYRKGENTLSPVHTLINALFNGRYDLKRGHFHISDEDFVGWERLERESLNLIMIVDVSRSTYPFIKVFADILDSLTGYFKLHKDRIGLISLQGRQAEIMNHPTNNYRIVTRNLLRLRVHGETPLADGLLKAIAMARLERQRKPGSRNIAILLSDCYPEPLTGEHMDLFDEPAYRETVRVASLFKMNRISLLVINPSFTNRSEHDYTPGERLSNIIARESKGRLIKLYRHAEDILQNTYVAPAGSEIRLIISGVEEMLGSKDMAEGPRHYFH